MSSARLDSGWLILLRPKWLCWHACAVVAVLGMLWLGRWQLHRAETGNELSWAYTFEWPLFALFTMYFWGRTVRDELRTAGSQVRVPMADRAEEENAEAYLDRLRAEVRGHGRWHGWR
jgi:CO/xanthine dehydrogenase Mo-binding subunit